MTAVALDQSRFDSALPACPPVLDFHAFPSYGSRVPSPLTLPSGCPKSFPGGIRWACTLPSRVLHSYSYFYYHTLCTKNTFLAVPTWSCTPELPTCATDCPFGGRVPIVCWLISKGCTFMLEVSSPSEWLGDTFDTNLAWNMCEAKPTFLHSWNQIFKSDSKINCLVIVVANTLFLHVGMSLEFIFLIIKFPPKYIKLNCGNRLTK